MRNSLEARPAPVETSLASTLADPDSAIRVATIDDIVVGYGAVTLKRLHDGSPVGHLTDLYVLPEARGVGLGEALMGSIVDWSTDRECIGLDSLALPGDRATKNFFESFGMVARALLVHRSLTPDDPEPS